VSREGLQNVEPRLGTETDPNLPPGELDAALMVDVYPEIEIVERVTFLRNLSRALKPNGRIGVVNYKPGQGGPGPASTANEGVRVESAAVEADARAAGLRVLSRANLPFQYLIVLGR
jgi:predicted methyltransferase